MGTLFSAAIVCFVEAYDWKSYLFVGITMCVVLARLHPFAHANKKVKGWSMSVDCLLLSEFGVRLDGAWTAWMDLSDFLCE